MEINGVVQIGGIRVAPGDIVIADDTGICFIPRERASEVLALAMKRAAGEKARCDAIARGDPLPQLLRATAG